MKVNKIISWLYTEGIDFKMNYESPQYTIELVFRSQFIDTISKSIIIINQPPNVDDDGEILELILDGESILSISDVDLFLNCLRLITNLLQIHYNKDKKSNYDFQSVKEIVNHYIEKILDKSFNLNHVKLYSRVLDIEYENKIATIKHDLGSLIQNIIDDPDNIF